MNRILRILSALSLTALLTAFATAPVAAPSDPSDPANAPGLGNGPTAACTRVNVCTSTVLANGEAYAGSGLMWRTNFSAGTLELVDLANNCTVVKSCPAPGAISPSELTLLNGVLYHYDFGTDLLYAIDPATCQVLASCDPPGDDFAEGLTNDGVALWRSDSTVLIRFTPPSAAGPGCEVLARCPLPPGDAADGLTMCEGNLIMLGYSGTIYRIDPNTCEVTGRCDLNTGASGNGLSSNRMDTVFADNSNGDLDSIDVGCRIPLPVSEQTWGAIKALYR